MTQQALAPLILNAQPKNAVRVGRPPGSTSIASQARVLDQVLNEPGISRSKLVKNSGMSWGTICHHVDALIARRLIVAERVLIGTSLFSIDVPAQHRRRIALLNEEKHHLIFRIVSQNPGILRRELETQVGGNPRNARRAIANLVAGFVLLAVPNMGRNTQLYACLDSPSSEDHA